MGKPKFSHSRKYSSIFISFCLVSLALLLGGCKKDPRVAFIQGGWYNQSAHLANIPAESAQETYWEFDNGYFSTTSCCFVKSDFEGNYSIASRGDNELTLDLFNMRGMNGGYVLGKNDSMSLVIKIDTESDTISMGSAAVFTRSNPGP